MLPTSQLRLYLVRHGQVEANREFRYVGRRDEALTELGRQQAAQLSEALGNLPLDLLLSSPLSRTAETARPIARRSGLEVSIDERLAEQSFGLWEGLSRDEIKALGSEHAERLRDFDRDPRTAPPEGESQSSVQERVVELVEELAARATARHVALVSHVGPIKALLGAALEIPLSSARRLFLDPATITVVDWGRPSLLRLFNAHSHLGWENARWMQES